MRIWISAAFATALAACAPTPATEAGMEGATSQASRCFFTDRILNFAVDGSTKVYLRSHRGDIYELTNAGGCSDIDFASGLGVTPLSGGSNRICVGEDARVQPIKAGPADLAPTQCRFTVARVLTSEEVAALPARARP